ncbi:putative toxin-antitoxin system toxin component, PIN family [Chloroflexota bacterium]
MRIVVDTNLWIRALLGGRVTLPVLEAWRAGKFTVVVSQPLIDELNEVWQRPRLSDRIREQDAERLVEQLRLRGEIVEAVTVPPRCRDPKDHPVLATAIDGRADAIVTGDADLRADDRLRSAMEQYGVALWGVNGLLERIAAD